MDEALPAVDEVGDSLTAAKNSQSLDVPSELSTRLDDIPAGTLSEQDAALVERGKEVSNYYMWFNALLNSSDSVIAVIPGEAVELAHASYFAFSRPTAEFAAYIDDLAVRTMKGLVCNMVASNATPEEKAELGELSSVDYSAIGRNAVSTASFVNAQMSLGEFSAYSPGLVFNATRFATGAVSAAAGVAAKFTTVVNLVDSRRTSAAVFYARYCLR